VPLADQRIVVVRECERLRDVGRRADLTDLDEIGARLEAEACDLGVRSRLTFIAGSDPAGVNDMEGRQRADKATGELLWGLDLVALGG
jgi:hypothetical protein